VRSVLYRFPDLEEFERMILGSGDAELELGLPSGEAVDDGEWVLAIFELGAGRRAMSAAGRSVVGPEGQRLVFEPRDWRRLAEFAQGDARAAALAVEDTKETRSPDTAKSAAVAPRPEPRFTDLEVASAGSAEEALEMIHGERFDLAVLDWNLPKMSGVDLCRSLRREPGFASLPVLFLTANASSQDMVDAFASGADDYVVKPFRAPELGARIFALLRRARTSKA